MLSVSKLNGLFLALFGLVLHCWLGFLPLLTAIITSLAAQFLLALWPMSCFVQIPLFFAFFIETVLCKLPGFLPYSLLYVRLLSFYSWPHANVTHIEGWYHQLVVSEYAVYCICSAQSIYLTIHVQVCIMCIYGMYRWCDCWYYFHVCYWLLVAWYTIGWMFTALWCTSVLCLCGQCIDMDVFVCTFM